MTPDHPSLHSNAHPPWYGLAGAFDESSWEILMRVSRGVCIGCGTPKAHRVYWRYRITAKDSRWQYDYLTVCDVCSDNLATSYERHAATKEDYDRWWKMQR